LTQTAGRGRALVTGGAGFIGSHLIDLLLRQGYAVRILDALSPQVHPAGRPSYLDAEAELRVGDVRDPDAVRAALRDADVVVHFAAAVGVGQSMYEAVHYSSVNVVGTATLLEAIVKEKLRPRKVLVASSMSIYGEGLYSCPSCGPQSPRPRPSEQLARRDWAMRCSRCGAVMEPEATPEEKPCHPTSVYAVNKRDQEEMVLAVCRSIGVPAVAMRFFNAYGERQALSNPYTGVAAIFSSALLNRKRPLVFEDGAQRRDFIHVSDIVEGCALALQNDGVQDEVFNLGTGVGTTLLELLTLLSAQISAGGVEPQILGTFREGDIRACYADVRRARERLGFAPRVSLPQGVRELARWVESQSSVDLSASALDELRRHELAR
jgi:dTDP-L-rhamnose 4-epimerase